MSALPGLGSLCSAKGKLKAVGASIQLYEWVRLPSVLRTVSKKDSSDFAFGIAERL